MLARFRLSPAMVVACVALVVALGGTSYAVSQLPANSVGTAQLKKDAVKSLKIKNGTINGADINEVTLGKVPLAAQADNATNAGHASNSDALGGLGVGSFLRSTAAATGDLTGSYPSPTLRGSEAWHELVGVGDGNCGAAPTDVGIEFCGDAGVFGWMDRPNASGEDYNTVAYYRDREGIVRLKGLARCFVVGGCPGFSIFILPVGYRPPHTMLLPTRADGGNEHYVEIRSDGSVHSDGTGDDTAYVLLDGLSFRCGPAGSNGCK